ncbi:MAG: apolipoprotein N-acyltransferase [Candidatus Aminicenantes bacterium]|nr:apolipoprotein N-acyltransferase [Candidatus Aminicenantes bacterium]
MRRGIGALLGAAASGAVTALAFPKAGLMFPAWLGLIPLLFLLSDKSPGRALGLGWTAGTAFYAVLLYWIPAVPAHYGNLPPAVSLLVYFFLALLLASSWGVFGLVFALLRRRLPAAAYWAAPFIWVGQEYLVTHLLTGFPWGLLGLSQTKNISFLQMSAVTGVYGLSFVLVLFQSLFVASVKFQNRLFFAVGTAFAVLVHAGGFLSLKTVPPTAESFPAAVIQGNVPSDVDWNDVGADFVLDLFDGYLDLTRRAADRGARLVVWPEFTVPLCFSCREPLSRSLAGRLQEFVRETGTTLLVGTNEESGPAESPRYHNTAVCLAPDLSTTRYAKMHLVPFGEYTPYKKIFGFINRVTHAIGEVTPGTETVLHAFEGIPFGSPICYEVIFPDLVRRFTKKGAAFLVTITNDGWYGRSAAPHQHFAAAVVRAVENRRFLLRAATTGISGIIDPYGRVLVLSEIGTRTFLEAAVTPLRGLTFYARHGDVFAHLGLTIVAVLLILSFFKRRP